MYLVNLRNTELFLKSFDKSRIFLGQILQDVDQQINAWLLLHDFLFYFLEKNLVFRTMGISITEIADYLRCLLVTGV